MAVIATVLGIATPSLAALLNLQVGALNIVVPSPPPPVPALPVSIPTLDVDLAGVPGILDVPGGLNQAAVSLNQLLGGSQNAVSVATPFVQNTLNAESAEAIATIQTRAQAAAAAATALDFAGSQAEVQAAAADLQAQVLGATTSLLLPGVVTGLAVAQDVMSPVCSLLAVPASLAPGLGVDLSRAYNLASPAIQQLDASVNKLIGDTYNTVYDQLLGSATASVPTAGPILAGVLTLLKYDWTSTYQPPTGAPIVKTTKALLNVPTPIDVDNSGIFDFCATLTLSLTTNPATGAVTGAKVVTTITKMPLAKAVLPVQLNGGLLGGALGFGYDARESTAPVIYSSATTLGIAGADISITSDNAYAVHRGTNLTIPPAVLNALPVLPTIPPLTTPAPKPILTQQTCFGSCTALAFTQRFEDVPATTHVATKGLGITNAGYDLSYSGASTSDSVTNALVLGTTSLVNGFGADRGATAIKAPKNGHLCFSFANGSCSNSPTAPVDVKATHASSMGFEADSATSVDQYLRTASTPPGTPTTCAGGLDVHATGSQLHEGHTKPTNAVDSGALWVDTADQVVEGCSSWTTAVLLTITTGGSAPPSLTMPAGFKANGFLGRYKLAVNGLLSFGGSSGTRTGTVACSPALDAPWTSVSPLGSTNLTHVMCPVVAGAPVNLSLPTISFTAPIAVPKTLTAGPGLWNPRLAPAIDGLPSSAVARQWLRCDATGDLATCTTVLGTGSTYTTVAADKGKTIRLRIIVTNPVGGPTPSAPAFSAPLAIPAV